MWMKLTKRVREFIPSIYSHELYINVITEDTTYKMLLQRAQATKNYKLINIQPTLISRQLYSV